MNVPVVQRRGRPDRQRVPSHAIGTSVVRCYEQLHAVDKTRAPKSPMQQRTALEHHRAALEHREPPQRSGEKWLRQRVGDHKLLDLRSTSGQRCDPLGVGAHRTGRAEDYDGTGGERREHPGVGWRPQPPIENHAKQRTKSIRPAGCQQRIVGEDRTGPDRDRVHFSTLAMDHTVRGWSRQPRPFPWPERHATVERQGNLQRHEWSRFAHADEERGVERLGFALPHTGYHFDAVLSQERQAAAGDERIGILAGNHRATNPPFDNAWRARAGPAGVAAGLERAIERRPTRPIAGIAKRVNLSVRRSRRFVKAAADHDTLGVHDHGADHRIRRRATPSPLRERERARHEIEVYHLS